MKKQIWIALAATGALLALGACSKHETTPQQTMMPAHASAMKAATAAAPTMATHPGAMSTAPKPATVPPPRTGGG
ncbi:MAG: hypothetical protein ACRESG_04860 [Gammaproteobacteria bacterium]